MSKHICIVAGDMSGDTHAAAVSTALKKADNQVIISALGGTRLAVAADDFLGNIVELNAFGFFAPVKLFFTLRRIFNTVLLKHWSAVNPDAVILVDYYGFNIHVARAAHERNIPVYYYISPQVWASRPGRIAQLKKYVTRMLVILPFEKALYESHGIPVTCMGHPLLDSIPLPDSLPTDPPVIGLFPGSRRSYFMRHVPILLAATELIKQHIPNAKFMFFVVPSLVNQCQKLPFPVISEDGEFIERRKLTVAITTSGTVSLENTLLGIPMVVLYRLSWFNYVIARMLVKIPYITMANILAQREIVPEYIQRRATPENIADGVITLLSDGKALSRSRESLLTVRQQLGQPGVSVRVAQLIVENIS